VRRGELWTASGGKHYAGKPRLVLIIQDDAFDKTGSVTVCLLTTDTVDVPLLRIQLEPDSDNGLSTPSRIMVDKVTTTELGTTLANSAGVSVATVEHLMAALFGMGIDNAIVEIDGPEVPILDGSSEPFIEMIEMTGTRALGAPRRMLEILKPVEVV
jgi:mRNA-degrading endonuclease toxin of MazEF toxin-antitoxin module